MGLPSPRVSKVGVADGFPQHRPRPRRPGRRAAAAAAAAEPAARRGAPGVSAPAAGDAGNLAMRLEPSKGDIPSGYGKIAMDNCHL